MRTDQQLQLDVIDRIRTPVELGKTEIGVAVQGGVATLTGTVNTFAEKLAAERQAETVSGVLGVANDISVHSALAERTSDTAIAHEAVHALLWGIQVPEQSVKVAVDDGWVDLIGEVEWDYQRHAAEAAVRRLSGIRGVNNLITLKTRGPLARQTLDAHDSPVKGSLAHSSVTPKPAA